MAMKALKRLHTAYEADDLELGGGRLGQLASENRRLRELVQHGARHSSHSQCGYDQMNAQQRSLYDAVVGRRAPANAGVAAVATRWRGCEFCGCRTNAVERVCCRQGRDTDRRSWDPPAA